MVSAPGQRHAGGSGAGRTARAAALDAAGQRSASPAGDGGAAGPAADAPWLGRRHAALLWLGAWLLPWAAAGCASSPRPPADDGERVTWQDAAGRPLDREALLARLRGARWLLLGEVHDNPVHHRRRAELLRALLADGRPTRLVFEQIDRGHDAALAAAVALFHRGRPEPAGTAASGPRLDGSVDAMNAGADAMNDGVDAVVTAGQLDRRGWAWPLHRPLFEAALAGGAAIAGGNLSRADAARVVRGGTADLPPELRRWFDTRLPQARWTAAQQADAQRAVDDGHCHALPQSMLAPMTLAQRARDAALADAMLRPALGAASVADARTVLIAGDGHVQTDIGVPHYLRSAGVAAFDIVSVGLLEGTAPAAPSASYDVVGYTKPVAREDPCQDFTPPPAAAASSSR